MNKYIVTMATINKHKKVYNALLIITYIIFFPFVVLECLYDLFGKILSFISELREKIVYGLIKILFRKDCKIRSDED